MINMIESVIPGVPSLGKYEPEWMLQRIMADPDQVRRKLIQEAIVQFDSSTEECREWLRAAEAKFCEMQKGDYHLVNAKDVTDMRQYFGVEICSECKGAGGFLDTTYDRTGAWSTCTECNGYGEEFNAQKVRELCFMKKQKVRE